jgi:hypothetical protein
MYSIVRNACPYSARSLKSAEFIRTVLNDICKLFSYFEHTLNYLHNNILKYFSNDTDVTSEAWMSMYLF